jgi:hypothetical protein
MLRACIIILSLGLGWNVAAADSGLFVEPGVTYQALSSSIDYPAPFSNSTGKLRGFGIMGRLGFHINDAVFVAADARWAKPRFKDSTNGLDADATYFDIGPVVGVQMPVVGLRVWAGWIATSTLDPEASNGFDYKFSGGNGYRVGAGFHVAVVSLNLEYQHLKYGTTTVENAGPLTGNYDSIKYNGDGWFLSVSFPIEL